MASFDLGQTLKADHLIAPQAWDGGTALTSAIVDTQGAEGVAVLVRTGAVTAGADLTIKFHEGDASDFTPGSGNEIPAARIISSPDMDDTANSSYVHSVVPYERYIAVVVSRTGTDAAAVSASAILGFLAKNPAE